MLYFRSSYFDKWPHEDINGSLPTYDNYRPISMTNIGISLWIKRDWECPGCQNERQI